MSATTRTFTSQQIIRFADQKKCQFLVMRTGCFEQCGQPATTSCTDSVIKDGKRSESGRRYGCAAHPVIPMYYGENGEMKTWEAHVNAQT